MPHDIILTFAGGMGSALLLGYLAIRLGLSPIVGYLLAGVAVGPHTPGFAADGRVAEQFAEIGIILLMFGVGLKFHLHELAAVWRVAVPGAIFQSLASTVLALFALSLPLAFTLPGTGLSYSLKFSLTESMVAGLAVSVASTVVLVRVLSENRDLSTRTGHIAVGWVVVEDLLTILLLVALPVIAEAGAGNAADVKSLGVPLLLAAGKVALCVLAAIFIGGRIIPWILSRVNETKSKELFMLATLTMALGLAVLAAKFFGVSMALGAFLAGLVVARSDYSARAAADAMPMRDAFAVLFFVSVGMLFEPRQLLQNPLPTLVLLTVVMLGKPLAAGIAMRTLKEPKGSGLQLGAALGQVGEFTFILGTAAKSLGLIGPEMWNSLVAAAMVSIAANPTFYRRSRKAMRSPASPGAAPTSGHAVIVGFGDVGRKVLTAIEAKGLQAVVVDTDLPTVRRLQKKGKRAICGDGSLGEVLEQAGVARAKSLIICCSLPESGHVLKDLTARNPGLRIVMRRMEGASANASVEGMTVIYEDIRTAEGLADAATEAK